MVKDKKIILWQYLDFWQFKEIIKRHAFFFAFKDSFRDACEGADNEYKKNRRYFLLEKQMEISKNLTDQNANLIKSQILGTPEEKKLIIQNIIKNSDGNPYITNLSARNEANTNWLNYELNQIGSNCWTLEENFCKDMVHKFVERACDFVAIKSSLEDILTAFIPGTFDSKDNRFYHNKIQYHHNYSKAEIVTNQPVENLYHMIAEGYLTEKEYRFTVSLREVSEETGYIFNGSRQKLCESDKLIMMCRANKKENGFFVPVNLDLLGMEIHCPESKVSDVQKILSANNVMCRDDIIPEII